MSVHSCKWVKRRAQKVCLAEILTLSKAVVNKKASFRLLLQYCPFEWSLMLMEQQKEQLQCCSKMRTTWPKSSWAIFLRCQQTNAQTQVLRSFSAFAVDDFSLPLPDKTAPREQWHTYGRALDRQKSGLGALLSSCSPSARPEPAASDGTAAWETHRECCFLLCKIHQGISPMEGMGLSVQAVSDSWCGEKNSSFEKSCWFNIIIAKAEKSTN